MVAPNASVQVINFLVSIMPVGNQWKAKAKEEAAAKAAAAAAPPVVEPQEDGRGKKSVGGKLRSKSTASDTQPTVTEVPAESNDPGPVGKSNKNVVAGKWTAAQDDPKV